MKTLQLFKNTTIAACVLLCNSVMAQAMSPKEFNANKGRINQEYKAERKTCNSKASNAKAICVAHAKGQETVALAEIQNTYLPTVENQYKVSIAKGEAAYKVAKYKCDDLSGNPKDVYVKEAKAALASANADATMHKKTAAADVKAISEKNEVRADAYAEKRAAQLKVAEEKCEAFASTIKEACLTTAKEYFGKL